MKTIATELNIKNFPFEIKNENGQRLYLEDEHGNWSRGEYDSKGNLSYFENSDGYWIKREYNSNRNKIYSEDSNGVIRGNRPKEVVEMTMEEVNKALGKTVKVIEG